MGIKRALIIGSDKDSCSQVREFLESKGLIAELALDYEYGIERLFYEKPDVVVFEVTRTGMSDNFISKVGGSDHYRVVDFEKGIVDRGTKPVLLFEDPNKMGVLLNFLSLYVEREGVKSSDESEEEGDLTEVPYPHLLVSLYRGKRTGVLSVRSRVKLTVHFLNGVPVSAEGGDFETALGRMLIANGKIQKTEYEKAVASAEEKDQMIGRVLIEMGAISTHELSKLLELQVKEKVIRGFKYKNGAYAFKAESGLREGTVAYYTKMPNILYEGVKRHIDAQYIESFFLINRGGNPSIQIVPNLSEDATSGGLSPKELRFVHLLRDGAGINNIVSESSLGRDDSLKLLFFLFLVGYLKAAEIKAPELKKAPPKSSKGVAGGKRLDVWADEEVINLEEIFRDSEDSGEVEPDSRLHDAKTHQAYAEEEKTVGGGFRSGQPKQSVARETGAGRKKMNEETRVNPSEEAQQGGKEKRRSREEKEALINEILKFYSTLDGKDYYQLLGVTGDSTKDKVKESYFELVRKFHPDTNSDLGKEIRHKSEQVFVKIAEAYQTLSDEEKRAQYNAQLETSDIRPHVQEFYEAEVAYKKGKLLLQQRSYHEAEAEFKKAVDLNPDEAAYTASFAWATFLSATDKDKVLADVKDRLEKTISINPEVADTYYYLGCIYKQMNLRYEAEANFSKAVQCDPNYLEAKRELWLIQKREDKERGGDKERKGKGFLSGLFKK